MAAIEKTGIRVGLKTNYTWNLFLADDHVENNAEKIDNAADDADGLDNADKADIGKKQMMMQWGRRRWNEDAAEKRKRK